MKDLTTGEEVVSLEPTKAFFVHMLTKDIELEDAVLDLLDNCVDGALRSSQKKTVTERPYEGFYADLHFSGDRFTISDNCGGISNDVRDSAFRLGRPPGDETDKNLPTVGTYGIGMKRAIFKIGRDCKLETQTALSGFSVHISREWMAKEGVWNIPVDELPASQSPGTRIEVSDLREDVAAVFDGPTAFPASFKSRVSQYYSVLIEKGFEVRIDGIPVPAMPLSFRSNDFTVDSGIAPYIYESEKDGVTTEVLVGFFAPFDSNVEEDPTAGRAEEAGWTVVCNDRVTLYKDKTNLTGWGDGAPNYHPQFRQIAGIVTFTSAEPSRLPITTTKRGINIQNAIYLDVRKRMRDGLKIFTSYTNTLKRITPEQRDQLFRAAAPVDVRELRQRVRQIGSDAWTKDRTGAGRVFIPPLPKLSDSTDKRMVIIRPLAQVRKVARFLFGDSDTAPSEVAARAFDHVLEETKGKR